MSLLGRRPHSPTNGERPAKIVSSRETCDFNRVVTITAGHGEQQKQFIVHEHILQNSDFFVRFIRALGNDWKEAEDRVIPMSEDPPALVGRYIHLLYHGVIPIDQELPLQDEGNNHRNASIDIYFQKACIQLVELYIFANKVQDLTAKNMVLSTLMDHTSIIQNDGIERTPGSKVIDLIYDNTPQGDPAQAYLTDLVAHRAGAGWLSPDGSKYSKTFLCHLARALLRQKTEILTDPNQRRDKYLQQNVIRMGAGRVPEANEVRGDSRGKE